MLIEEISDLTASVLRQVRRICVRGSSANFDSVISEGSNPLDSFVEGVGRDPHEKARVCPSVVRDLHVSHYFLEVGWVVVFLLLTAAARRRSSLDSTSQWEW